MNTPVQAGRLPAARDGAPALRYLNLLLCLVMLGFTAVQYNDPDALLWIVFYMVPAVWAYLAAMRLPLVRTADALALLWITTAIGLAIVISYWPQMAGFWRQEVWLAEETAREGMGLMVAWGVLLVALFSATRRP